MQPAQQNNSRRGTVLMAAGTLGVVLVGATLAEPAAPGRAAAFRPGSDEVVVAEVRSRARDPVAREMAELDRQVQANPRDRRAATRLARLGIEAARRNADPRSLGRAQAALGPWWSETDAPADVLLLRATIRQARHEFVAALSDLDRLARVAPEDAQAHLTRSVVLTVRGRYAEALAACETLAPLMPALVTVVCRAPAQAASGQGKDARAALARVLEEAPPAEGAWARSVLGELCFWAGDTKAAEQELRRALALDPHDRYTRALLADLLLDARRADEAVWVVEGDGNAEDDDGLLLRLALAETQRRSARAGALAARLRESFAEARRRGEALHAREESRFVLAIEGDAGRALTLARTNWDVQREPWDARALLEAALAAGCDRGAAETAAAWVAARGEGWAALQALADELRRRS